jgi:SAM-dependent methyltransferase
MIDHSEYRNRLAVEYAKAQKVTPCCPICERSSLRPYVHGDRHQLGMVFSLCGHCGMLLAAPRPDDPWLAQFYAHGYWPLYIGNRYRDEDDLFRTDRCAERAAQIFDGLSQRLPQRCERYLDVGCGQGGMLREFRHRYPDATLFGIEPSADAVRFCKQRHQLDVVCGEWLSADTEFADGCDFITMTHVVEHVTDPVSFVRRGAERLNEQGQIYVEVPDLLSTAWRGADFFHLAHLQYFTEHSLRNLFARAGLTVQSVFHGLADSWPWAIGVLGRVSDSGPLAAANVPAAPTEFFSRLERHLRSRLPSWRPAHGSLSHVLRSVPSAFERWACRIREMIRGTKNSDVGGMP